MGKLILHIGTHKTATTSIQRFLRQHDRKLQNRGVYYPDYTLIGKPSHYAHFGIVNGFSGAHDKLSPGDALKFFQKVARIARDQDLTILSAESFYRHGWPKGALNPERYWRARNEYIARLKDIFGEAQIVVVFRSQADYAESLYQETVKVTKLTQGFNTFVKSRWPHFSYLEQAQAWNKSFPGLKAMSYHKLVEAGDVVEEFSRLLSIPIEGLPAAERFNERMPHDLVALKRMANGATSVDKRTLQKNFTELGDVLASSDLKEPERRSFFASDKARRAFQDSHAQANEALRPFMIHAFAPGEAVLPPVLRPAEAFGEYPSPEFLLKLARTAVGRRAKVRLQPTILDRGPSKLALANSPSATSEGKMSRKSIQSEANLSRWGNQPESPTHFLPAAASQESGGDLSGRLGIFTRLLRRLIRPH